MLRELTLTITNSRTPSVSASATEYSESPRPARTASRTTTSSRHSTVNTTATPAANIHNDDQVVENDLDAFEGDSSMAAQTVFASEFLHKAVGRTSFRVPNPDMESALQALQQMVAGRQRDGASHESRFEHVLPIPPGGFRDLPKPPTEVIVGLLRMLKGVYPGSCFCAVLMSPQKSHRRASPSSGSLPSRPTASTRAAAMCTSPPRTTASPRLPSSWGGCTFSCKRWCGSPRAPRPKS